jgi:hypothetical protein
MVEEEREIAIKLSGDRGEYGTVTVAASRLDSAWVEEEIRRVYEAGGLPAFMAVEMARRVVEDVKAAEEKRSTSEVALAAAGVGKRRRKAGLREPLAFVVAKNWWENNYGGVQGLYRYVEGYYEIEYGIGVEFVTVDASTDLDALGNAKAGKYYALVLIMGHGNLIAGEYVLEGGIRWYDFLSFLDSIMVKGAARKGIAAAMCFAGHPWVKEETEMRLNTVIKGGDLVAPLYCSIEVKNGIFRFVPIATGMGIMEAINGFYGVEKYASWVEWDGTNYELGSKVD